jgi:hypothetical protein
MTTMPASPFVVSLNASRAIAPSMKRSRLSKGTRASVTTAALLDREPHASLPIPHLRMSALIVPNASNRLVVGLNAGFFCLCLLYRRDPSRGAWLAFRLPRSQSPPLPSPTLQSRAYWGLWRLPGCPPNCAATICQHARDLNSCLGLERAVIQ